MKRKRLFKFLLVILTVMSTMAVFSVASAGVVTCQAGQPCSADLTDCTFIGANGTTISFQCPDVSVPNPEVSDEVLNGLATNDGNYINWEGSWKTVDGANEDKFIVRSWNDPVDGTHKSEVYQLKSDKWVKISYTDAGGEHRI